MRSAKQQNTVKKTFAYLMKQSILRIKLLRFAEAHTSPRAKINRGFIKYAKVFFTVFCCFALRTTYREIHESFHPQKFPAIR